LSLASRLQSADAANVTLSPSRTEECRPEIPAEADTGPLQIATIDTLATSDRRPGPDEQREARLL